MKNEIAIKVENLTKTYKLYDSPADRLKEALHWRGKKYHKDFHALNDVSFEIKKGETVGIIGKNGSGKSTLLKIITGVLSPTSGKVTVNGRVSALLELGAGFNPEYTGMENIYFQGNLMGYSNEEMANRVDAIVEFADIGDFINQPVKSYSSGMFARLAFAVAINVEPDILIVDEALSVGDWLFQKKCFQKLERYVTNGNTLIFVSHDQESIRTLTNKSVLLHKGKMVEIGLSSEVILEYRKILHAEEKLWYMKELSFPEIKVDTNLQQKRHKKLKSFGYLEAEICSVRVLDENKEDCNFFLIGSEITILIGFIVNKNLENLNVAFRVCDKKGAKITSWGTLNRDIKLSSASNKNDRKRSGLFWNNKFVPGVINFVEFTTECTLGAGMYELQVTVTREHDFYYGAQEILHWKDEAAFFKVGLRPREYIVGGVCDLKFDCKWFQSSEENV